jgi:acyl CoA:acetate/3-ketoacid CoA transferase alpha subunit/acyl CoA:acetate/3-ketoacid CoA transferase beta subunit
MNAMSKLVPLAEAVQTTVEPGATVLFAFTHNRSHAAAFEVARQFRDRRCLDLVATGLLEYASILCAAGAVRRVEAAFAGNTYPAPAPSRQLGQEIDASHGSDPHWTNLTMTLRLMAGAMGWPFVPTASLVDSDLWSGAGRAQVRDPFGGKDTPVLAPLRPDVTFLHVPIADTLGNAVVHAPDAEECWGVWAARHVVVTAERVVSPEELRRLGPRSGIPGHVVDCVVEAPFGAHPQGQFVWSEAEGVLSYADDDEFRLRIRALCKDPRALRAWVEEWVFATDHGSYVARLGEARLARLRALAEAPAVTAPVPVDGPPSPEERAATVAMRIARSEAAAGRAETLFAGIGLAHLAAWAAERECRVAGIPVELVAETGMVGFRPVPGDPYLFSRPNAASALFHSSFVHTLGVIAGPAARRCLALLAAAQVDRAGNVNSSRSADGRFIVGSGGANDLASGAASCLVVMPLKPGRFVEKLPFTTTPIRQLAGVATDLGVLERAGQGAGGALRIASVMCERGRERETVDEIRRRAGQDLPLAENLSRQDPPLAHELERLRSFDPKRVLLA